MRLPKDLDDLLHILHKRCWIDGEIDRQRLMSFKQKVREYATQGYDIEKYKRFIDIYNHKKAGKRHD